MVGMFYCEECRVKNGWPESYRPSYGPCEVCKTTSDCHDVPSHALPDPRRKKATA